MSSVRYHVNPESFKLSICSAKVKCQFAGNPDARHFEADEKEEAQKHIENLLEKKYTTNSSISKPEQDLNIEEGIDSAYRYGFTDETVSSEEFEIQKRKYFQNFQNLNKEEKDTFQRKELAVMLNRLKSRVMLEKGDLQKVDIILASNRGNNSTSELTVALRTLNKNVLDNIYKYNLTDDEVVNIVRDYDVLTNYTFFAKDSSMDSYERRLLENNEPEMLYSSKLDFDTFSEEDEEKLRLASNNAINRDDILRKVDNAFYNPINIVKMSVQKAELKRALRTNDNTKIAKNLGALRDLQYNVLDKYSKTGRVWSDFSRPMNSILEKFSSVQIRKALQRNEEKLNDISRQQ